MDLPPSYTPRFWREELHPHRTPSAARGLRPWTPWTHVVNDSHATLMARTTLNTHTAHHSHHTTHHCKRTTHTNTQQQQTHTQQTHTHTQQHTVAFHAATRARGSAVSCRSHERDERKALLDNGRVAPPLHLLCGITAPATRWLETHAACAKMAKLVNLLPRTFTPSSPRSLRSRR